MNPGDRDAKVIFLLGGLIVALYFFTIFALIYRYSLSLQLLKEGGIYETIGALACLGAALTFFMAYIKYPLSNTLLAS